ncbi:hypothetical protein JZU68_02220, partial [bacterium]|nr:hypothetical protein [bacterium]
LLDCFFLFSVLKKQIDKKKKISEVVTMEPVFYDWCLVGFFIACLYFACAVHKENKKWQDVTKFKPRVIEYV